MPTVRSHGWTGQSQHTSAAQRSATITFSLFTGETVGWKWSERLSQTIPKWRKFRNSLVSHCFCCCLNVEHMRKEKEVSKQKLIVNKTAKYIILKHVSLSCSATGPKRTRVTGLCRSRSHRSRQWPLHCRCRATDWALHRIFIPEIHLKRVKKKRTAMRFVKSSKGNEDPQKAAQRTARKTWQVGAMETKSQVFNKENVMKLSSKNGRGENGAQLCTFGKELLIYCSEKLSAEQNVGWFKTNVIKSNTDSAYHTYRYPHSKRFLEQQCIQR